MKPNPLEKVVTLSLKPHEAAVLLGALAGVCHVGVLERGEEQVIFDVINRIHLQLGRVRRPPDEAKKGPYPI